MNQKKALSLMAALALVVAACAAEPAATPTPAADTPAPDTPAPATPGPDTPAPDTPVPPTPTAEPVAEMCDGQSVSFLLSFIPNVQHAGFLVAANRGYYEEEGITVDVQAGGPGTSTIQAVADASVEIGQPDYGEVLQAREAGAPVVAFAQTYKDPFFFWYAHVDSGISSLEDWAGQRVGAIQVGEYPERDAMLTAAEVDPNSIVEVQQDFGIDDYKAGNLDIGEGVVFFHPASLQLDEDYNWPDDFHIFRPAELGADVASQMLATNETFLAENPDVLRCFLRASIRGWEAAIADPQGAIDDVMAFIPEGAIPRFHQEIAIDGVLPIMGVDDPTGLLEIDVQMLEESIETLVEFDFLSGPIPVEETFDSSIYDTMGPVQAP